LTEKFQIRVVKKKDTSYSITFFYFEIYVVCELMWKYMLERTATDNNMARAHRLLISKATDALSVYEILIA